MAVKHSNQEYVRLYRKIRRMPAVLTEADLYATEQRHRRDDFGVARRVSLSVLTLDCSDFFARIEEDRDTALAFASIYVASEEYLRYLDALRETVQTAHLRVMVGLCGRQDMDELIAIARAEEARHV